MFLGLRTIVYPAPDLQAAKKWWTEVLGFGPYFDEPFFVGFNVGGYELGLNPAGDVAEGPTTYWGVPDADAAFAALLAAGATEHAPITDVGEGIRLGSVLDPTGLIVGVIENPIFALPHAPHDPSAGPGK